MRNIVTYNLFSQVFIGTHCCHDCGHSPHSTAFPRIYGINDRSHIDVHLGYSWNSTSSLQLSIEERRRTEHWDGNGLVYRRFWEDSLLCIDGTLYDIQNTPFQFVLCGIVQLTVDIIILGQIIVYGKKEKKYDAVSQ